MKTAYLYIRVSTDEQADTGYSQRHQEENLRRYCELQKIAVVGAIFEDHSAKTFNRPAFAKLLVQLRKNKGTANLLLFTKWDRFSRNAGDAYQMINTLAKLGVEPQAVEQPLDLEVPENKMMLAFYLAAPEVENDRRSLNIRGGMRRARKEGRWMGTAPIGYRNQTVNGKKTIVIDPVQGPIMRWVFEQLARGTTVRSLMKLAVERGLATRSGKSCCKTSFWAALRNPAYCGKIRIPAYKSEEEQLVPGFHEPLITEALFYQAQDVLDGKKRSMRIKVTVDEKFPMRGYLLCPTCGRLLTASSSSGRSQKYHYYHCYSGCSIRFQNDRVHTAFARELTHWKPNPVVKEFYGWFLRRTEEEKEKVRQKELRRIRDELAGIQERKVRVRKLMIDGQLDADDYRAEKIECEAAMARLEAQLQELTPQYDVQQKMEEVFALLCNVDLAWEKNPVGWKRELLSSMFPEKLTFTGESFRTARVNEVAELLFNVGAAFSEKEKGQNGENPLCPSMLSSPGQFSNRFIYDLNQLVRVASLAA